MEPGSDDEAFESWLRQKLALPALPSFSIPLDAFVDSADQSIADQLDVAPGLYEGIAVVDARCNGDEEVAADASGVFRGRDGSGSFTRGSVEIEVQSDGSGRFTDGTKNIVIQSDGSGSYGSDSVQLEIQGDGSGTYEDGTRSIVVDADGSGTYTDADIAVEVTNGSSTYRDALRTIEVSRAGEITTQGDGAHATVVARVLANGLPRFPPVPHIGPVPEPVAGTSCGSVIRIDANVLFEFDSDTVMPAASSMLDRVGALLLALHSPPLRIDGHTDSIGGDAYNLELSARRADAVRAALVARGVDAASLTTRGVGEAQPLAPNVTADGQDDPAARQLNRRVELVLLEPA